MSGKMRDGLIKRGAKWAFVVRELDPLTGKTKPRWYSGFATRAEALQARNEKRVEVASNRHVGRRDVTVAQYLQQWLTEIDVKPKTLGGYRFNIDRYITPGLGQLRVQDLAPARLTAFYAELHRSGGRSGGGLGYPSIRAVHRTVSTALTAACRAQLISSNPARFAVLPKKPVVGLREAQALGKHRAFSAAELARFLEAASAHRLGALFHAAAYTGARRGELLCLRWSDLSLEKRELLTIYGTRGFADGEIREGTTKGGKVRTVSLDPGTSEALRAYRRTQRAERLAAGPLWADGHDYVFLNERGLPIHPDTPSKLMREFCAKADLPRVRFHDLRHTHATLLLSAGLPVHEVADRLGHADATITLKVYATALEERRSGLGDSFAALMRVNDDVEVR